MDQIKELQCRGVGPKWISERLNLNRKTVAKYMAREALRRFVFLLRHPASAS